MVERDKETGESKEDERQSTLMKNYTTLHELLENWNEINSFPCIGLGEDLPVDKKISFPFILEKCGWYGAVWALRANMSPDKEKDALLFACQCIERILPFEETAHPNSQARRQNETVRKFANGEISKEDFLKFNKDFSVFESVIDWSNAAISRVTKSVRHESLFYDARNFGYCGSPEGLIERKEQEKLFIEMFSE